MSTRTEPHTPGLLGIAASCWQHGAVPVAPDFRRQITRAVLAVVGLAAAIGLVIALIATVGLRMAGVSGDDGPAPSVAAPDPEQEPEESTETPAETPAEPSATAAPGTAPATTPATTPAPREPRIQLWTTQLAVSSMERVTLAGRYRGGEGVTLLVQRKENGSWVAFPTSARVQGGGFNTYVALGQPGPNQLRVVDPGSGQVSNAVVVNVS